MRKILLLAFLPLLANCALFKSADKPEERYYAINNAVVVVLRTADSYVSECKEKPIQDDCRTKFPAINKRVKELKEALSQTDKVFISKDSQFYELSLTVLQNALKNLQNLLNKEAA
jgi:hypothetical protein